MSTTYRDYRDQGDVEDALDAIRVAERDEALHLYRITLDTAHQQGVCDGVQKCLDELRRVAKR